MSTICFQNVYTYNFIITKMIGEWFFFRNFVDEN
jgi:hypothetical protein